MAKKQSSSDIQLKIFELNDLKDSLEKKLTSSQLTHISHSEDFHRFSEHSVSQAIKEKRKEQKLSEKTLSELSGVSRSTIQRIESGSLDVNFNSLYKIMKALGLELAWK